MRITYMKNINQKLELKTEADASSSFNESLSVVEVEMINRYLSFAGISFKHDMCK